MARHLRRGCQLRFGLLQRRCKLASIGLCQYCSREFCADHGSRHSDGQEVCQRTICQQKVSDLALHLQYREAVRVRNAWQRCGVEECQSPIWGQCSGCHGFYCFQHLHNRTQAVWEGRVRLERPASLCDHCWARRSTWRYR